MANGLRLFTLNMSWTTPLRCFALSTDAFLNYIDEPSSLYLYIINKRCAFAECGPSVHFHQHGSLGRGTSHLSYVYYLIPLGPIWGCSCSKRKQFATPPGVDRVERCLPSAHSPNLPSPEGLVRFHGRCIQALGYLLSAWDPEHGDALP